MLCLAQTATVICKACVCVCPVSCSLIDCWSWSVRLSVKTHFTQHDYESQIFRSHLWICLIAFFDISHNSIVLHVNDRKFANDFRGWFNKTGQWVIVTAKIVQGELAFSPWFNLTQNLWPSYCEVTVNQRTFVFEQEFLKHYHLYI